MSAGGAPAGAEEKIGVLLAQLGTPDAPTASALRRYLKEFLSDPRMVEENRLLWWLLLRLVILPRQAAKSARRYARIWTPEGSPLKVITSRQQALVFESVREAIPQVEISYGMRYGSPSLPDALDALRQKGCNRLLLFPMFPQYSAATTASVCDAVFGHLLERRWVSTLRVAEPFFVREEYLAAQAQCINEGMRRLAAPPEYLLLSYHGLPESYINKGDPYCRMCAETTAALRPRLDIAAERVLHTYQSRFGRQKWVEPYTDRTLRDLAAKGVARVAVACPGFVADCVETLDEIAHEAGAAFIQRGGRSLDLIPCLNDHPAWIQALNAMIRAEISGW
jgi:protoporphyrin/coproporphyrin ferrochelatase